MSPLTPVAPVVTIHFPDGKVQDFDLMAALNYIDKLAYAQSRQPPLMNVEGPELMRMVAVDHLFHYANLLAYTVIYFQRIAPPTCSDEHLHMLKAMRILRSLAQSNGVDLWPELAAA